MLRRCTPLLAAVVSCLLVAGGLALPASAAVPSGRGEQSVRLFPVSVLQTPDGSEGGAHPVRIRLRDAGGKEFRVGFTEDEVAGTGDQWRAAGWSAATVATLLTGAPLGGREVTFDLEGRIDGPSAGALMTVGLLSLFRGDDVDEDVTMTGTINPDGTVGPVGGIPYKIDGAVEAGKTRMLIPLGQRNSTDDSGNTVDVVDLGSEKGVEVLEVADIYEAYEEFTGEALPRQTSGGDVALKPRVYDRLEGLVQEWLAEFDAQAGQFNSLDPSVQALFVDTLGADANAAQQRAVSLSQQGLQAGAYSSALEAAALARAAVVAGRAAQTYATQGLDAFIAQIDASSAIQGNVDALLTRLKGERPRTLGAVSGLIDGYGYAFDALAVTLFAEDQFDLANQATGDEAIDLALLGAVSYDIAGTQVEAANQLLDLAGGGARLRNQVDPTAAADFFRKAAQANLQAFDSIFVETEAEAAGVSADQVRAALAGQDFDYALAQAGFNLVESRGLEEALGGGRNAAYGDLGGSVTLYVRANALIAKYYSLVGPGCLDDDLAPVCVGNERSLTSALELAQSQVEGGVSVLIDKNVDPTFEVGAYEIAVVEREGDITDKLDALDGFLTAFIKARVLAYLGDFPKAGLG